MKDSVKIVLESDADKYYCPFSNSPCEGERCMMWRQHGPGGDYVYGYCGMNQEPKQP